MIHITEDGYSVNMLGDVLPFIKHRAYKPTLIETIKLTHKGLDIDIDSPRFLAANINYPLIVLRDRLFVVDGRHRLKKHIMQGSELVPCYLIEQYVLDLFKYKRGCN